MIEISPATFEDFKAETARGNVVPVVRSVLADLYTPVGAFLRIADGAEQSFLLESIEGGERLARYSFLAANPFMTVRSHKNQTILEKDGSRKFYPERPLVEFLRKHFARHKLARREKLPPLCGGAVGFLAYDAARWFEPVLDNGEVREETDAIWMFFRNMLVFDRLKQRIEIVSIVFTDEANGDDDKLRKMYDDAVAETARLEKQLAGAAPEAIRETSAAPDAKQFSSNWKKPDFLAAVDKIKDYILAGDAYQVVLSQNFKRPTSADPVNIYRALRTTNPSPYMFFVKLGDETLIGASPEMLVRCSGRKLEYRPIAGTRKRGATETEDWVLAEDLRSDMKEISEHVMLVDLGRNDLGRVSEYGSVEVAELMKIEKYSHVQHLVTSLKSRLKDGLDRFDALGACFPAGTVSGAPKVRAMQIIGELEPSKRGVYAGAIGYIDYAENLDTCIAIRTIRLNDGVASIQAGAGVVADSVPEKEYEETINKARALVKAIEMAEKNF